MSMDPTTIGPSGNDTQCADAAATVKDALYLIPSGSNMLSSMTAFMVVFLIYKKRKELQYDYHINAKILFGLNASSHCLFSGTTLINYYILFYAASQADDCKLLHKVSYCSNLRRIFLFCTMLTTSSQSAIVVERLYATYHLATYEVKSYKAGVLLTIFCVVLSFLTVFFVTFGQDPDEFVTNCFAFSSSNIGNYVYYMFASQLAFDFFNLAAYYLLRKYLARISMIYEGDINKRYQAIESNNILKKLGPLIITSSVVTMVYILFSSTGYIFKPHMSVSAYKQLASWIFIMPHNSLVAMYLYYILLKRGKAETRQRLEETLNSPQIIRKEDYMDKVKEEWENAYRNKDSGNASPRSAKIGFSSLDF